MKLIGVIGAGASGLCSARHILATGDMKPVIWEQSSHIGGTWRFSDDIGTDKNGYPVHSSMYESLRTDLPKVVMQFPDYDFPVEGDSFVHHTTVLRYLESYAQHFNLYPYVKLGHRVETVHPLICDDGPPTWKVTVKDIASDTTSTTICDALIVCNGHFSVPRMPQLENSEMYKGIQNHSHDYREPSPYKGLRVVVLGASMSGLDISLEVSSVAKEVLLSHNLPLLIPSEFPPNFRQVRGAVKATEKGFILADGSYVDADAIIYCTGYEYSLPFLSDECGIMIDDRQVKPLYKHLININYPSMALVGLTSRVAVFRVVDCQVQYFLETLKGNIVLPSSKEMLAKTEAEAAERRKQGWKDKDYHTLQNDQFPYMADLAMEAKLKPLPTFVKKLMTIVIVRLFLSFSIFKNYQYSVRNDGTIVESKDGHTVSTVLDMTRLGLCQFARLLWRDFFRLTWILASSLIKMTKGLLGLNK